MKDNFEGVPPEKRAEIGRRVNILREFAAIKKPTPGQREKAMAELGLSRAGFYNLLKAWKASAKPADLPGANRPGRARLDPSAFSPALVEIIVRAVVEAPLTAETDHIDEVVRNACKTAGLPPPNAKLIDLVRLEVTNQMVTPPAEPALTVDHCAIRLPSRIDGAIVLPILTAAISWPDGSIIAHTVSFSRPTCIDTVATLSNALSPDGEPVLLQIYGFRTAGWAILNDVMASSGLPPLNLFTPYGIGSQLQRAGAGVTFQSSAPMAPRSTLANSVEEQDVGYVYEPDEAIAIIEHAINGHNASRGVRAAHKRKVSAGPETASLLADLSWLATMPTRLVDRSA